MSTTQYAPIASVRPMPNSTREPPWSIQNTLQWSVISWQRCPNTLIHRVHLKGDNNATGRSCSCADRYQREDLSCGSKYTASCLGTPTEAVQAVHLRGGPKGRGCLAYLTSICRVTNTTGWTLCLVMSTIEEIIKGCID
jgi:hypothetical protein